MNTEVIIVTNGKYFRAEIWLPQLYDFTAPAWAGICRLLARHWQNDETTGILRKWFPEAIAEAEREAARAEKEFRQIYKPLRNLPKEEWERQKLANLTCQEEMQRQQRKLSSLQKYYEKFEKSTKEII
jgi:hypothetical protein